MTKSCLISIVIPIFNEEESIPILETLLYKEIKKIDRQFEIIAVNDGSTDDSGKLLSDIAARRNDFKVVKFRRNYGQTAALMAGVDYAQGDIIVTMDADLQNDPGDITLLLDKLEEGYDVVSGWRKHRKDATIRRNLLSRIANRLVSRITGLRLHDYGCTLKAYRRDVIKGVRLYGEMHRFIPIYASWMGAKVVEIPVKHHPRKFGKSKYGLERTIKVLLDLMVVRFLDKYLVKPIYIFGGFGLLSIFACFISGVYMIYLKIFENISMIQTPLPVLSAMLFLVGVMSIFMGLIAEILIRTYFESQQRTAYFVRDVINIERRD